MAQSLYKNNDGVVILTDSNCTGSKITSGFKGPGVLKAYAVWCPHCVDKVSSFKLLAECFREEQIGLVVYVIEADQNRNFSSACEIEAFPTIMYVDEKGNATKLTDVTGNGVSEIPEILQALCQGKKKCLKTSKCARN
jgi:hypothetical protein